MFLQFCGGSKVLFLRSIKMTAACRKFFFKVDDRDAHVVVTENVEKGTIHNVGLSNLNEAGCM